MTRVLVVDDKQPNVEYLRALLEGAGWTVDIARHGAEALTLANQHVPDLVISDLLMPVMDGYTLLRHWKADPRLNRAPFIVYTATYTDAEDERLALDLGADDFILKPTEPEDFMARIRTVQTRAAAVPIDAKGDGPDRFVLYNEALIRKLEEKSVQLENTKRQLELELVARIETERLLHERGARLNLFLELGDVMRAQNREQLFGDALRLFAEHFAVSRCVFTEIVDDRLHVVATYPRANEWVLAQPDVIPFRERILTNLRAGTGAFAVQDVARELGGAERAHLLARGIGSFICVPMLRHGQLRGVLMLGQPTPRDWTPIDIVVIREVLERLASGLEHYATEARLRQTAALLRIAGEAARLGGWSLELPSHRVTWSDEMCVIHDVPIGTHPSAEQGLAYYAPEFQKSVWSAVEACIATGAAFDLEVQLITAAHRRIWVRCIGQAERDNQGVTIRVNGALQDIDETRKLEDQFRQAQKMEAVGRLAGGVAHDFNNLLSVILSYSEFLLEDLTEGDPVRNDIVEVHRAAERAADLTRQLLTFSRHKAVERRVIDLTQVIHGMNRMLRRLLGEDIELSVQLPPEPSRALADPGQIEQIIMNLAVNARDAMPDGGRLDIEVSNVVIDAEYVTNHHGAAAGPFVMIAVTDSGIGMDAATQEKIFEPFFTTKEKGKGTGLGLSTVFGIAQQCGGFVWVYSEVGMGTTFKVYIQRTDEAVDPTVRTSTDSTTLGTETVLVVEDDEQVRQMTGTMLRRHGYTVVDATNGGEALLICEQHRAPIHLMITDVVMPRMSGSELAKRVAILRPEIRVLYFSGYTEETIIRHGMLDPAIAFLEKPVSSDTLLRKVRELLHRDPNTPASRP